MANLFYGLGTPLTAADGLVPRTGNALGSGLVPRLTESRSSTSGLGMLASQPSFLDAVAPRELSILGSSPAIQNRFVTPQVKRKAYFSFRFEDIMRVNNVRKAWRIFHPDSLYNRTFYDRSIWEKSLAEKPESLKNLMRGAMTQSGAVCVLVGSHTWLGRWVKYEIARSVVDKRGLLAVHFNGLYHIDRQAPDPCGLNPMHFLAIFHNPN